MTTIPALAATLVLGLSAGAMLTEAVVFVSFWRSLPPAAFLAWFAENEPRLVAFFAPLQLGSVAVTVGAAGWHGYRRRAGAGLLALAALLTIGALAMYPLYFRDVNASFAGRTLAIEQVPRALAEWSRWQWVRTGLGMSAFAAALLAVAATRRALR